MDKHGWLKIIESFIAIILVMAIVLVVVNNDDTRREDVSSLFYNIEKGMLGEIQLNNTLREEILGASNGVELNDTGFPAQTRTKIEAETPSYISCTAKICASSDLCVLSDAKITELGIEDKDIYAEAVMITSTSQTFNPKVLKLFCWD